MVFERAPHLGGQLGIGKGLPDRVHARVQAAVVDEAFEV